jgi:hypothetical protein
LKFTHIEYGRLILSGTWSANELNGFTLMLDDDCNMLYRGDCVNSLFQGTGCYRYMNIHGEFELRIGNWHKHRMNGKCIIQIKQGQAVFYYSQ